MSKNVIRCLVLFVAAVFFAGVATAQDCDIEACVAPFDFGDGTTYVLSASGGDVGGGPFGDFPAAEQCVDTTSDGAYTLTINTGPFGDNDGAYSVECSDGSGDAGVYIGGVDGQVFPGECGGCAPPFDVEAALAAIELKLDGIGGDDSGMGFARR
jgi:hypothetical protein